MKKIIHIIVNIILYLLLTIGAIITAVVIFANLGWAILGAIVAYILLAILDITS